MDKDRRSRCPIATSLDEIGDRWSLVVVRDLAAGKRRFGDFLGSPEGIPTNILADRLRRLERLGIVRRRPYAHRPLRHEYLLTEKGADLLPVLQQLAAWAHRHVPGCWTPPGWFYAATPQDLLRKAAEP